MVFISNRLIFFFQAEEGIRDIGVTGVQTCALPIFADLLDQLRSPSLHAWQPGGGAAGALSHAVIHSLDVTVALDRPAVAPLEAMTAVLAHLTAAHATVFRVGLTGVRLEADDCGGGSGE